MEGEEVRRKKNKNEVQANSICILLPSSADARGKNDSRYTLRNTRSEPLDWQQSDLSSTKVFIIIFFFFSNYQIEKFQAIHAGSMSHGYRSHVAMGTKQDS